MKWYKFDKAKGYRQKRPPMRKYVLVRKRSITSGFPDPIVVGYRKDACPCCDEERKLTSLESAPVEGEDAQPLCDYLSRLLESDVWRGDGRRAAAVSDALESVKALSRENARRKVWVDDLQSGMCINCVYCGHRYGPSDKVPASINEALRAEVERLKAAPVPKMVQSDVLMLRGVYGENDELNFPAEADLHGIANLIESQVRTIAGLQGRLEQADELAKMVRGAIRILDTKGYDRAGIALDTIVRPAEAYYQSTRTAGEGEDD